MQEPTNIFTSLLFFADFVEDSLEPFITMMIFMGMIIALMLPIIAIPYIFIKLGSVAGILQAKGNSMAKNFAKDRYKRSALGREAAARKQSRDAAAQRRWIEGRGVGGKLAQGRRRVSGMGTAGPLGKLRPTAAAGNLALTEQLQEQQQKLEDARTATLKQAVVKNAGLPYAPLVGQMRSGETAAAFATRYASETGQALDTHEVNDLEGLRGQFGNQIGTTEFSRAALLASHDLGSDVAHIDNATRTYANQMKSDGKSDLAINNELAGVMDSSAKAGGVYAMSGAGWDARDGYGRFNTKNADRILVSADFGKFDSGQFGDFSHLDPKTGKGGGSRDVAGKLDVSKIMSEEQHALAAGVLKQLRSSDPAARTAMLKRIAEARGSKSFNDLAELVEITGQSGDLNNLIAGFK